MMRRLREAHAHIAQHGRAMAMAQLADVTSREACLAQLAATSVATPPDQWVLGVGIRAEAWADPVYPTAREIDAAVGDRPCCAWSFDHHALVANSQALAIAGISRETPNPPHGLIDRDTAGEPTGLLLETAAHMLWSRVPEPQGLERTRVVKQALADFARHGFVEIHDLHAPLWLGRVLAELDDAGALPAAVWVYVPLRDIERAVTDARGDAGWERPRVRLAGAKVFADGTLNSRTAWMLHPYVDGIADRPCGEAMMSVEELVGAITRSNRLGVGLAVHAIGDGAVRAALDAAERVRREGGGALAVGNDDTGHRKSEESSRPPWLRIEHAEIVDEADVPRFAKLGVTCSPQPCHLLADIEALQRYLPHRLDRVLPLRELIDAGCAPGAGLWFGSDAPIVRPHPEDSILAAVTRRRAEMRAADAIAPGQAISEAEAWAGFRPSR